MRTVLKASAEKLLRGAGVPRFARRRRRGRTMILAYHNIIPDGAAAGGDTSLHLARDAFARQLDRLERTHEVVPLGALFAAPSTSRRPRAVITFDDAYQGALTAGIEELGRRGLPATIFITPAFIGGRSFWWDALAHPTEGLADHVRRHGLEALCGRDEMVRRWAVAHGLPVNTVPAHQTAATEAQLSAAAAIPGITFASHTWSHPNLSRLTGPELDDELARPLAWLRARFDNVLPWISYPYGLSSPEVRARAQALGYEGALRIDGAWVPADPARERYALPRLNIPAGVSVAGFELRAAGVPMRMRARG
ncbi:MAG TPA: polysaccharide deacetylase family protein [Longimicrobiales bacterium]